MDGVRSVATARARPDVLLRRCVALSSCPLPRCIPPLPRPPALAEDCLWNVTRAAAEAARRDNQKCPNAHHSAQLRQSSDVIATWGQFSRWVWGRACPLWDVVGELWCDACMQLCDASSIARRCSALGFTGMAKPRRTCDLELWRIQGCAAVRAAVVERSHRRRRE